MEQILIQEFDDAPRLSSSDDTIFFHRDYVVTTSTGPRVVGVRELIPSAGGASVAAGGDDASKIRAVPSVSPSSSPTRLVRTTIHSTARYFRNIFLPVGYPDTVRLGYWDYQVYDSIQGLCSYLRGVVSSAHVLQAAGVGNAQSTAWGAAVTWALRDGMGLLGGLVFSASVAPLFDSYVKEFRFFADLILDVGLTLDMLLPVLPQSLFLWISALSTLCKAMCGISAGATKGCITQHFAVSGNLADLHAKEGTQESLVSLLGMSLGIGLARYFQQLEAAASAQTLDDESVMTAWRLQWSIFGALTLLHVLANYRAISLLRLRTLNRQRAVHVFQDLIKKLSATLYPDHSVRSQTIAQALHSIPGPTDIQESLVSSTYHMILPERWSSINLGTPLVHLIALCTNMSSSPSPQSLLDEFANEHYVLGVCTHRRSTRVWVSLLTEADAMTELQAFLHALLVQECCRTLLLPHESERLVQRTHTAVRDLFCDSMTHAATKAAIGDSHAANFSLRQRLQEQDWELQNVYLGFSKRRSRWSIGKND
jgi:hypothetical protein